MKKLIKKILKPIGIWSILKFIKHKLFLPLKHRLYSREFIPLSRKSKLIFQESYVGKHNNISHSQSGQELFIYEQIFHEKETGTFVEVGGNDPVIISNSYTLEKLGWTGISFEPIISLCDKWATSRTTKCYPYVIGDKEDWIDFEEVTDTNELNDWNHSSNVMSSVAGYGRLSKPHSFVTVKKQMRKLERV